MSVYTHTQKKTEPSRRKKAQDTGYWQFFVVKAKEASVLFFVLLYFVVSIVAKYTGEN